MTMSIVLLFSTSQPKSISSSRDRHEPTFLETRSDENLEWTQISCGGNHTVALSKKGEVYTWGMNNKGELGHGDNVSRDIPTKVKGLDGVVVIEICSCGNHTVVLTDKGELFIWFVRS